MAEEHVFLKLLVDKEKNRVLSAEAGKDFMDALFSFLTMPLGTIARIVGRDSNLKAIGVGSLSSLYQSVANLEEKHFWTETCKEMLLWPRSSMECHQNMKLNIDDSNPLKYFICKDWDCSRRESGAFLSTFKNKQCSCGKLMNRKISLNSFLSEKNHEGYVSERAVFTISDDLKVMPSNIESSIVLQKNFGTEEMDLVEEMTVKVDQNMMMDLLKCSLVSKTPLTNVFLQKKEVQEDFDRFYLSPFDFQNDKVSVHIKDSNCMKVKVLLRKSKSKVLFAQAEEDFVDFLLSFLTLPLGAVLNLLQGNSGSINLDNLFKSLADLHVGKDLRSEKIKNMLIKPQIASQFKLQNMVFPIDEATAPNYSCFIPRNPTYMKSFLTNAQEYSFNDDGVYAPVILLNSKSSNLDTSHPCAFVKGPSLYMVTDDLAVTPISSIFVASFLNRSKIPLHDLEEKVINIGLKEALNILKASLISSSALTMGLNSSIDKALKGEERRGKDNIDCIFSFFWEFILKREK